MKIICSKENLLEGINIVQKAVSTRTTIPVLEGILFEADDRFKLTGNDLETGIECFIAADIREKGAIVISSRLIGEIARRLPDADILLETKENNIITIECENTHFEIKGMPAEGYPSLPAVKMENAFKIPCELLKDMIRKTNFAVGIDDNRPVLKGSFLEYKEGQLTIVSSDSYRVAMRRSATESTSGDFAVIIPGRTLSEIARILKQGESEVSVYCKGGQILFDMGESRVVSRLIEGEYFKYRSFIPEHHDTELTINVAALLSAIERASLIITSEERRYPIKFKIADDKIIITSNTDIGSVREEIKVEIKGSDLDIGFNPRYFIEALRVMDEENISMCFSSGICTLKPTDNDTFINLIVPLRK